MYNNKKYTEADIAKTKTIFYCTSCGNESPKWQGRCSSCGAWNTMEEHIEKSATTGRTRTAAVGASRRAQKVCELTSGDEIRFSTGMGELDRVLGGGAVAGSLVLVGGAPGIGKSTLLLQICNSLCAGRTVLYVSGEESERQIKMRATRLGVDPEGLYVLSETRLSDIMESVDEIKPDILIVDSIQTLYNENNESSPGSVSQVKDCTMTMMQLSKADGITVFVVGHINKDGNIAGPKVLEHMVDCVLYFEGDPNTSYRLLRAAKNRFGSTNEIGVFEMMDRGLVEVPNPSQLLLAGRPEGAPGTCVACVMEGTRPVLAEVQALVAKTSFNVPRRTSDGFDFNRAALLMAVAEKRGGMKLSAFDLLALTQFTVQEKRAMMAFVMGSAWADGHLDYREEQVVEDIASLLKMTEYDMQQIEQNFTPEKSEIILKKMDNIKKIFYYFVNL